MNRKKTQRLYCEEGLAVRRRRSRRRIAVARTPIPRPEGPNRRWSTDFVQDQLASGRRFRVLTIIDDVTKECLAAGKQLQVIGIFDGVFHDKVRVGRGAGVVVAKRILDSQSSGYGYLALAEGSSAALTGTC